MKIAVVVRQTLDLVEPLEVADSQTELDLSQAGFLANESDEHALEQALLLKEAVGGDSEVMVVALDFGEVDNTLYTAAARGADRIIKASASEDTASEPSLMADVFSQLLQSLEPDLVLLGCWAPDEWQGPLGPRIARALGWPFAGVIRGVEATEGNDAVSTWKEFPGASRARLRVQLPAVLGIQGAERPPRYAPVSRIRAAMKTTEFERYDSTATSQPAAVSVLRMYPPEKGERAEMLHGSDDDVAAQLIDILSQRGVVK